YRCALVHWLSPHGNSPDDDTGLWVVTAESHGNRHKTMAIIHLDCIAQCTHLLPVYGSPLLPEDFHFSYLLNVFRAFFVNCYADHLLYPCFLGP
ncbi:hypothetical protein B0H10DRAFT_1797308, partial [Mycena sp. CBHHK59/15]